MTFMCMKSSLRDVYLFHPDLVVARMKVKFSEKLGSINFIQNFINNMDMKFVLNRKLIVGLEIMTHVPSTFLL
jgi:hypothetical protein